MAQRNIIPEVHTDTDMLDSKVFYDYANRVVRRCLLVKMLGDVDCNMIRTEDKLISLGAAAVRSKLVEYGWNTGPRDTRPVISEILGLMKAQFDTYDVDGISDEEIEKMISDALTMRFDDLFPA